MSKRVVSALFFSLFLAVFGLGNAIFIVAQEDEAGAEYGPQWDKSCNEEGICEITIYSYEKYWNDNGEWEEINEDFYDCSEEGITKYCTNNYYFNARALEDGTVSAFLNGEEFSVKLNSFRGNNAVSFNPVIVNGSLIYEDILPGIDLRYKYLPRKLKEDIVIKEPLSNLDRDFDIIFTRSGNAGFNIPASIICDSNYYCEETEHEIRNDEIIVRVPVSFLNNSHIEYPVYIDPTIQLDDSDIAWNGYVTNSSGNYTRTNNPTAITLSNTKRGDMDWNISAIPDGSDIISAVAGLRSAVPSTPYNVSVMQMEKSSFDYSNENGSCQGNCQFYIDMANGTLYNKSVNTILKNEFINYTLPLSGLNDIENKLSSGIFSFGLVSEYLGTVQISGRDATNASHRPRLTIVYEISEDYGDDAIVEGINNSLPGNPITSNQQVYLVNENGNHYLGSFDKATIKNNQTWAFNYVTSGEGFTDMPSLFRILNVWENDSLTYEEIVTQVELFINNTII